jgi:hypothetical protein
VEQVGPAKHKQHHPQLGPHKYRIRQLACFDDLSHFAAINRPNSGSNKQN